MKKFRVLAYSTTAYTLEIEAIDEDHAWEFAREADGSLFESDKYADDWEIFKVKEIK